MNKTRQIKKIYIYKERSSLVSFKLLNKCRFLISSCYPKSVAGNIFVMFLKKEHQIDRNAVRNYARLFDDTTNRFIALWNKKGACWALAENKQHPLSLANTSFTRPYLFPW